MLKAAGFDDGDDGKESFRVQNLSAILLLAEKTPQKPPSSHLYLILQNNQSQIRPPASDTKRNASARLRANETITRCSEINSTFLSKWLAAQRVPCTSCCRGRISVPGTTTTTRQRRQRLRSALRWPRARSGVRGSRAASAL